MRGCLDEDETKKKAGAVRGNWEAEVDPTLIQETVEVVKEEEEHRQRKRESQARREQEEEELCLKKRKLKEMETREQCRENADGGVCIAKEVTMLANVKHQNDQNVVWFIGACRKPMVWCIVTEYARGGSVRSFLSKQQSRVVPLKLAVKQALDVIRGTEYLHSLEIVHRDLKSDNLLIATDKSIKIADFGAASIEV